MAITTYTELKSSIADWLNRDDLTTVIPTFISLAEARLNRDLRVRQMVKRSIATLDAGFLTLPGDWLEAKNIQINTASGPRRLEYVTLDRADEVRSTRRYDTEPKYFNVTGNQLEVVPTVSGEAELEMAYYGAITPLSDAAPSNWLLLQWPDLYLYGALQNTAPYLREDERVATWAALYNQAVQEIRLADERAVHSGSVLKARTPYRS